MSNTTIQLRKSGQTGNTPANLAHGELAINYADGKLFYKNGVGIKSIENQKTFSTINANNSLIIATTPTDILNIVPGNNVTISTNTISKTVTINSTATGGVEDTVARELAQGAFTAANTAGSNTVYLQAVNDSQNTNITAVNTFSSSAFDSANAGVNLATASYAQANNASGNTVALQAQMTTTNTNVTSVNTFAQSGFNSANAGVTLAAAAYNQANTASSNTVYLQSINDLQNTNITSVNTFTGSAFNSANAGVALATSAYGKANAEGEINNTQNTWIANTNTFAQAAYNFANTRFSSSGGTISGNVTIQNDLSVLGNVNFIGNVTSVTVTGNSGQFFGYASNGFNALYAGIPVGYDFQPQTVFQVSANENGYAQINIQNINAGGDASSDLVATADNGTENDTYISVGIGSSQHADPEYTLVGPNDGYLYVSGNTVTGGGDLVFGTILENDIVFAVGGMNTENEQMRIIGSSNTISIRSNVNSSLAKSVLLGPIANLHITGGSTGQLLSTDGSGNLSFINSPADLASAAYAQANNASSNTVAIQAVNDLQNTNITSVNTFAASAFNSANAGVTLATAAFEVANTAAGNTVALQSQMTTTNTNITSVNTFAGSAFNSANAGVTLATAAFEAANTAAGNTVYLQTVNNLQNTNITAVNTFAQAAYDKANTGGGGSDTVAFAAYAQANNASSNTVALQAVNDLQNTNITSVNTFTQAAYNSANAGVTLATAAFEAANTAGSNTVYLQAVNDLQNTNITSVNTFAQAGFNKANDAVQTGFTTISANAVSITPANNADTLTINPGTNITISACTTTKTITINSTASGGGGGSTTLISDVRSFIANSGQTVFTVPTYVVGENRIRVFVNGVRQNNVVDYAETNPTTITLNPAADAGDNVVFEVTAFDGALTPNQNTWINNTDTFAKMAAFTANAAYNTANTPPTRGITTDASYYPVFVDANNSTASLESLHTNLNLNYNPSTSLLFVSSANILSLGVGTAPSPTGGDIRASNNITAFFSDERLKINIKPIDNALEKIQEISGVYYNTNELARTYGYTDTSEHVGVIAQQIQSVLPHAVKPAPFDTDFDKNGNIFSKSGENYLTVQYEKLIPLLIQAIKEQQEQIDELKRNAK